MSETESDNGNAGEEEDVDVLVMDTEEPSSKKPTNAQRIKQKEELQRLKAKQAQTAGEMVSSSSRFQLLMEQTDIYTNVMRDGTVAPQAQVKPKADQKLQRRHRLTEKEEDEAILKSTIQETSTETSTERLTVQPSILKNGTLRSYQLEGLNWLINLHKNGINGILADEMGLGKTIQTISMLAYLKEFRKISGPHMVIVPKSTLANWMNEFTKWCPSLRVFRFHGTPDERTTMRTQILLPGLFDVCVTTYEVVSSERGALCKFAWHYIVIDEAHRIKNENSLLSRVVRMFDSHSRLLLTGTPLQNNLHELWALLNFLLPDIFDSDEDFDSWFRGDEDSSAAMSQLHKIVRPFLLRRLKVDVEKGLPPKKETVLYIGMAKKQHKLYKQILKRDIDAINGTDGNRVRLLNIVMQLRKCCNHPYLFDGQEEGPPFIEGEHLVESSGKLVILDKLCPKLKAGGHRVLVFCQMTRMLDILEDYCHLRAYKYCRIDGSTGGADRDRSIEAFNAPDSDIFIFLLSTRAGGLGINLATADTVILYDSDWNPQADIQAQDRAHRIGQLKPVNVYRFVIEKTIEQRIMERAMKKLYLDAIVVQQGRLVEQNKSLSKGELLGMIRYGADEVIRETGTEDFDIDKILERGAEKTAELKTLYSADSEGGQGSVANFSMDGGVYNFDGVDYSEQSGRGSRYFLDLGRRERVAKNVVPEKPMANSNSKSSSRSKGGPKAPGRPQLQDFQFFNQKRLNQIFDKEHLLWQQRQLVKNAIKARKDKEKERRGHSGGGEEEDEKEEEDNDGLDLTPAEQAERDRLMAEGFSNWKKADFLMFIKACEKHGRKNVDAICLEMSDMPADSVRKYAAVFAERYQEIADWDKYIKQIERGEQRLQRKDDIMKALVNKVASQPNAWLDIKMAYGQNKGKAFTEENDRYLICLTAQFGYGKWEEIKWEISNSWEFMFDWYFKSRTTTELARRVDVLVRLIEKETEDDSKSKEPSTSKRKRTDSSKAAAAKREKTEAAKAAKSEDDALKAEEDPGFLAHTPKQEEESFLEDTPRSP